MAPEILVPALIKALSESGLLSILLAQNGSFIIDDTSLHTIEADSIVPMSETVIAQCIVKSPGTKENPSGTTENYVSTRNWGATLSAGSLHRVPIGYKIISITLTSGSIVYY